MPNYCWNKVRIGADPATILLLKDTEFSFEKLLPQPEFEPLSDVSGNDDRWYQWRIQHWGTKWDRFDYKLKHLGQAGLELQFTTAWAPPTEFFKSLLEKYPDIWLKCDWNEEGGMAGIFLGYTNEKKAVEIHEMEWQDWCMEEYDFRMRNDDSKFYLHRPRSHCKDEEEYNSEASSMAMEMTRGEEKKFEAEIQADYQSQKGRDPTWDEMRKELIKRKADQLWPEYKVEPNVLFDIPAK
jgi:hypothetical protein